MENKDEFLYKSIDFYLIKRNDELIFEKNGNLYYLSSSAYEPCLYIKLNNKIIVIIHNSFNISEIEYVAQNNKIRAITGKYYDIKEICELIDYAISSNVYDVDISYLQNKILDNSIKELVDDIFYKEYEKYSECVLDYCIVKIDEEYNFEKSHKEAVIFAMKKWKKVLKDSYDMDIIYNLEKMVSKRIDAKKFLSENSENSYSFLFLNPPHGCNYTIEDFDYINSILFPNGYHELEVFEWSTNWSNYFDDGLEWWVQDALVYMIKY